MTEAYDLHEGRFISDKSFTSAADALVVDASAFAGGKVPEGKVWTILSGAYFPSAIETRSSYWAILSRGSNLFPVSVPIPIALGPSRPQPLVTEGMEMKLFPGEWLRVVRDVATAGSTMTMIIRFIEADMPYYSYEEPLNKIVKTKIAHGSVFRKTGGLSTGSGSGSSSGGESGRGGRSGRGGEPI